MEINNSTDLIFEKLSELFVDEYKNPIKLSPTQKDIFLEIIFKRHPRVAVICPTQYGKSLTTAMAVIVRAVSLPEKWVIIGGTQAKADIIMGYIIDHLFDNELFYSQLKIDGGKLEQLRRERRRDHLTFKRGGEIKTLGAEYRNRKRLGEAVLGEGGQNLILDDSCLCDDEQYAYIKRMVGGRKDTFILEISNPLKRNHFFKTMTADSRYKKIWIDWRVAVEEGRFTKEYIEEMREHRFFDIFYECKFPDDNAIDEQGYMRLLLDEDLEGAIIENYDFMSHINDSDNKIYCGVDLGRGGNRNVICIRDNYTAKIIRKDKIADTMQIAGGVILVSKEFGIKSENISIDDGGLAGVADRLKEQKYNVNGIKFGSKSDDENFANKRAEMYWRLREWIKSGGKIIRDDNLIYQLKEIKYKINSSGKVLIESKDEMLLRGIESPDEADALALTFSKSADRKSVALVADWKTY